MLKDDALIDIFKQRLVVGVKSLLLNEITLVFQVTLNMLQQIIKVLESHVKILVRPSYSKCRLNKTSVYLWTLKTYGLTPAMFSYQTRQPLSEPSM